jgi:hypothetical protein
MPEKNQFIVAGKKYRARAMPEETRRDVMRWVAPAFEAIVDTQGSKEGAVMSALGSVQPEIFNHLHDALMSRLARHCALGWRKIWNQENRSFAFADIDRDAEAQLFLRSLTIETAEYCVGK